MRFYICDLKTGDLLDEYPLQLGSPLERRLKSYGTGTLRLPVLHPATPENWAAVLRPWRVLIVVCDDDDRIVWGGIPTNLATSTAPLIDIQCVTVEKYFDRRYMPTASYRNRDQTSDIARAMAEHCGDTDIGIGLEYDTPESGIKRDRDYYNDEDARVLTRLQQLSNVINGFDWTIELAWADDDHSKVRKIFRTGYPALGYVTDTPEHTFTLVAGYPSPVTSFTHDHQWGDAEAATHVQAVGDGEGDDKPYSNPLTDSNREADGWPRLEERKTQQGVSQMATLNAYGQQMAERYFGGQSVISITARLDAWPSPAEITLGDSARIEINTDQLQLNEIWRIIGYQIDLAGGTWTPTLARIGDQEDNDGTG